MLMMFGIGQAFRLEGRTVLAEPPGGHRLWFPPANRNDDVREEGPRVIEIVLRGPRRVIRMRMIEPEQIRPELRSAALGCGVLLRPNEEAPARSLLGRIRECHGGRDHTVASI